MKNASPWVLALGGVVIAAVGVFVTTYGRHYNLGVALIVAGLIVATIGLVIAGLSAVFIGDRPNQLHR